MAAWVACRKQPFFPSSSRALATVPSAATDSSKVYSKTLLLPKTAFPQWVDPQKSEVPFRRKTSEDLYKWQEENAKGPLFVLHDGPPYANGNLHMGHAMNKILKDIINRFHVLRGRKVNYIPGWDCHGLPIEAKTLKELKREAHTLPSTVIRTSAKSVAEREVVKQKEEFQELGIMADWSKEGTYRTLDKSYEIRQLRVFQQMVEKGLIYRNYRPVHYSPSSRSALAEAELVYRDDHISRSVYVLFRLDIPPTTADSPLADLCRSKGGEVKLMVWTTTPWTLTANMGIAVNPGMEYSVLEMPSMETIIVAKARLSALSHILGSGSEKLTVLGEDLVGLTYRPLFQPKVRSDGSFKIVPSAHVTPESGTGLVHTAPAHGAEDYAVFRDLGLLRVQDPASLVCYVDSEGRYSKAVIDAVGEEYGERLVGLDVLVRGTSIVIEQLKEMKGVFVAEERVTHKYPYDWKTDKPIIVTATSQWFASLDSIKETAIAALKNVQFYPPESRNRLESFVRSRSEWCISRQRVWGVPIPSLHHLPTGETVLETRSLAHILAVLEERGPNYWWDGSVADFVPGYLSAKFGTPRGRAAIEKEWAKGTDTMDVWFDSGSSWSMLRDKGILSESEGHRAYADICLEGSDQHRGWFQSMLLTAMATTSGMNASSESSQVDTLPYRSLITHGMVLDQDGKKMSKSLGNVMSPMAIIRGGKDKKKEPAYGTDVLRFWAASVEFWRDAALGPTVLAQAAESLRKIRNTARFILGNIGDEDSRRDLLRVDAKDMSVADRYVMRELLHLEQSVLVHYTQFNLPRVVQAISRFANTTLSALYFDITKDVLYANKGDSVERRAVVTVLEQVLERMVFMMAPLTPHLAEEIFYHQYGAIGEKSEGLSVFTKLWEPLAKAAEPSIWDDDQVCRDMSVLTKLRDSILGLLEQARGHKNLRSSLEAEVDIIIPISDGTDQTSEVVTILRRHRDFLETFFIVSGVSIIDGEVLNTEANGWAYSSSLDLPFSTNTFSIRIRPSTREKCPRCWTYTRPEEDDLCNRCADAVQHLPTP
ncbi:hypothetical protein M0805_009806 [Coniferiporia weirii]|nr:hypothetical protein M0805_009806 [Coniferiporia weirii]